jgi:flavin-dependent thymidylate synthase
MITAKVIEHSYFDRHLSSEVVTFQLEYPRYIHSEFMTHRVFSRNASSSRAIPTSKFSHIAYPIRWGKNQPGMQPSQENLEGEVLEEALEIWKEMASACLEGCRKLAELGLHKQWANRPLEWFTHISVVVTATEWDNFYKLRDHPDAQDEIRDLAQKMREAVSASDPKSLYRGEWHLPYITAKDKFNHSTTRLIKMSAARCARVSYLTHDKKKPNFEEDNKLFDRLTLANPPHMSPLEHQCTPDYSWDKKNLWGNLTAWIQHRRIFEEKEHVSDFIA